MGEGIEPTAPHRLGEAVKVMAVGVDRERQRISLSIKRLTQDPWEGYADEFETGQTIDAIVTRVMPYGAFARVLNGVEGLIHISEIASENVGDPNEAVRIGRGRPLRIVRSTGNDGGFRCRLGSLRAHERCPQDGHHTSRTYNRNQMMPAPIDGLEDL